MNFKFLKRALIIAGLALPAFVNAQNKPNWQNLDLKTDSVFGISTEKAYTELLQGKKHVPVLVAVIDGGVDINHEDLKSVIWTNSKEIPGNKKDDDHNGYADDIHGWDFIGGDTGDVHWDNLEATRQVRFYKPKFENVDTTKLDEKDLATYHRYMIMKADIDKQLKTATATLARLIKFETVIDSMLTAMNNPDPTVADLKKYTPTSPNQKFLEGILIGNMGDMDYKKFKALAFDAAVDHYKVQVDYQLNVNYDPRYIVGDDYFNDKQRKYGNADVTGPDARHGTHVSGIIGAVRDNNIGVKGVANDVMIMSVRTVPDGDERDKDVANAIRYAAANGAKVINMSFGKDYSWDKKAVDEAVKYAVKKDVLLVHAAGNDNNDKDSLINYPNKVYADGSGEAATWIEVGASGPKNDETLKASFSSYGKTGVDVFAPGVNINSTVPGSKYEELSGTSMATPVVVGLAALIRSYYPKLTAVQVKEIILKSVTKVDHNVTVRKGKSTKEVPFSDLCATGGIVNAYSALKLAATY
jgi:subtilisin family serine protease